MRQLLTPDLSCTATGRNATLACDVAEDDEDEGSGGEGEDGSSDGGSDSGGAPGDGRSGLTVRIAGSDNGAQQPTNPGAPVTACRFRLLLVQEVLYQSIPFGQRLHLHTVVARALEDTLQTAQTEAAEIVDRVRQRSLPHDPDASDNGGSVGRAGGLGGPRYFRFDFDEDDDETSNGDDGSSAAESGSATIGGDGSVSTQSSPRTSPRVSTGAAGAGVGRRSLIKSAVSHLVSVSPEAKTPRAAPPSNATNGVDVHTPRVGGGALSASPRPLHIGDFVRKTEASEAARLDASLSIFPQLVHHWCLAQNEVR